MQVGEKEDLAEYVDLSDNIDGEEPGDKLKGKAKVTTETEPAPADTTTAAGSNPAPLIVSGPILLTSVLDLQKCISFLYASQYRILDKMDESRIRMMKKTIGGMTSCSCKLQQSKRYLSS